MNWRIEVDKEVSTNVFPYPKILRGLTNELLKIIRDACKQMDTTQISDENARIRFEKFVEWFDKQSIR